MNDAMRAGMDITPKEYISLLFDVNPDPVATAKLQRANNSNSTPLSNSKTMTTPASVPTTQYPNDYPTPSTDQMQVMQAFMQAQQQFFSWWNSMPFNPMSFFPNQFMQPFMPFDQAQWAQFFAFMQSQQQSPISSNPMNTTPSFIALNTPVAAPVPVSTMPSSSSSSIPPSLNPSHSPTVSTSASHQDKTKENVNPHQSIPSNPNPISVLPMGNPLLQIATNTLSNVSPPSSSISPPDMASLSSIFPPSHTLYNSPTHTPETKEVSPHPSPSMISSHSRTATQTDLLAPIPLSLPASLSSFPSIHATAHAASREKRALRTSVIGHPYLNRPPSRRVTQTDLLAKPRLINLSNVAKPTEKEAKRFRLMQQMAYVLLSGADPSQLYAYSTMLIDNSSQEGEIKPIPEKENDAWNVPARVDPVTAVVLEGLSNPIILKTVKIDALFHARVAKAIDDVPDFEMFDPTLFRLFELDIDMMSGIEIPNGKFYNQYFLFGYPNSAYFIRGGLNSVDAPLTSSGANSPMLNNTEKEFNVLRKIILWQSALLYRRGIVVDTSILTEVPTRGVLRRTIEKRIIELKKFYVYYGSTLSVVFRNHKKHEEFVMCGFLPKTIVDIVEIENSVTV